MIYKGSCAIGRKSPLLKQRCSVYGDSQCVNGMVSEATKRKGPDAPSILVMHKSMWGMSDWTHRSIALRNHMLIALSPNQALVSIQADAK